MTNDFPFNYIITERDECDVNLCRRYEDILNERGYRFDVRSGRRQFDEDDSFSVDREIDSDTIDQIKVAGWRLFKEL